MKHFKNFIHFTPSFLLSLVVLSANSVHCTQGESKSKNEIPVHLGEPRPRETSTAVNVPKANSRQYPALITAFLPNDLETKIFNSSTSLDTKATTDLERLEELLNQVVSSTDYIESQSTKIFKTVNATNSTNYETHQEILQELSYLQRIVKDMQASIKSTCGPRETIYFYGLDDFIDRMYYTNYSIAGIVLVILGILCLMYFMTRNLYRNQQRGINSQILQVLQAMQNEAKRAPLVATVCGCANSAYRLGDPGLNQQCGCNAHG